MLVVVLVAIPGLTVPRPLPHARLLGLVLNTCVFGSQLTRLLPVPTRLAVCNVPGLGSTLPFGANSLNPVGIMLVAAAWAGERNEFIGVYIVYHTSARSDHGRALSSDVPGNPNTRSKAFIICGIQGIDLLADLLKSLSGREASQLIVCAYRGGNFIP